MSLFVTFEGPEGSGKTTQIQLLATSLQSQGRAIVCTREPGGTLIGEQIRGVLHDLENRAMLPKTEALLYSAARAQHVESVIRPALEQGKVVLCDRYALSTLAYQGYGHGLSLDDLRALTEFATGGLWPDLVIYLDLDVTIGLRRKISDRDAGRGEWNRMDEQNVAFHRRVRDGYLEMARRDRQHWLVIDATQSVEVIQETIFRRSNAMMPTMPQGLSTEAVEEDSVS